MAFIGSLGSKYKVNTKLIDGGLTSPQRSPKERELFKGICVRDRSGILRSRYSGWPDPSEVKGTP
ncbi:hypothetical protein [Mucilaginibacter ginkgonis]|uniref:Uncharacterized protein n=1 Tax=Mucilaginibacter ginkgonis TaxID=2682091 RepID=A0A6I4INC2_9SPHI|nr:hypothetical protein [Mucilaginibacter ginkgonis]QQL49640.1 hypothetical protein GO620_015940 [Mucilaginibacter ginkgonis]